MNKTWFVHLTMVVVGFVLLVGLNLAIKPAAQAKQAFLARLKAGGEPAFLGGHGSKNGEGRDVVKVVW